MWFDELGLVVEFGVIRLWGKVDLVRFGGLFFLFGLTSLGWVVVALFAFGGYLAGFLV